MDGDSLISVDDFKRLENKIDLVLTILNGNGNPASGLIVRFDRVEQIVGEVTCIKEELYGGKDFKGLRGRVLNLEDSMTVGNRMQAGFTLLAASLAAWLGANR